MKVATFLGMDRPHVVPQATHCCRNRGTVSIVSVYGELIDKVSLGSATSRGLTLRMAQTPVQRCLPNLLERVANGEIDPSFVLTYHAPLQDGPALYKTVHNKQDGCFEGILKP